MNWFDAGALLLVALAVVDGAVSGLAWAALELLLLFGAALAAHALGPHAEPYVRKVADLPPEDLPSVAHFVTFALIACVLFGVLILLHPATRRWRFRNDRWFGGTFGALNGVVAALIFFSMAMWSTPRPGYEEAIRTSRLVGAVRSVNESGLSFLFPDYVSGRLATIERP